MISLQRLMCAIAIVVLVGCSTEPEHFYVSSPCYSMHDVTTEEMRDLLAELKVEGKTPVDSPNHVFRIEFLPDGKSQFSLTNNKPFPYENFSARVFDDLTGEPVGAQISVTMTKDGIISHVDSDIFLQFMEAGYSCRFISTPRGLAILKEGETHTLFTGDLKMTTDELKAARDAAPDKPATKNFNIDPLDGK